MWNLIWYFALGIFSLNSYFYYLTHGFIDSTCAFNLPIRTINLATIAFSLLTRGFELVTCRFEPVTRRIEFVTHSSQLVTGVLLFYNNNRKEILQNKDLLNKRFFCSESGYLIYLCIYLTYSFEIYKYYH